MDGVAHGLGRTAQAARDLARAVSGRAGQEDLGAAECEGAGRAQAGLELSPFRVAQLTNKDGWMHPNQMFSSPPSHKGSLEPALEPFPIRWNRKRLCESLSCRVFEPEQRDSSRRQHPQGVRLVVLHTTRQAS